MHSKPTPTPSKYIYIYTYISIEIYTYMYICVCMHIYVYIQIKICYVLPSTPTVLLKGALCVCVCSVLVPHNFNSLWSSVSQQQPLWWRPFRPWLWWRPFPHWLLHQTSAATDLDMEMQIVFLPATSLHQSILIGLHD